MDPPSIDPSAKGVTHVPGPFPAPKQQRRFIQFVVAAGLVGAVFMSLAMTNTLSAFVASITNNQNTAATGSLILQESGAAGTTPCNSTDGTGNTITNNAYTTCTTFNKYGGSTTMTPTNTAGTSNNVTSTVSFKNTGTATATAFSMAFVDCKQANIGSPNGSALDFCSKLHVKVMSGSTVIQADATAQSLANTSVTIPAAFLPAPGGAAVPFTFTTYVDNSAGNAYQGLQASQNITWTLTS